MRPFIAKNNKGEFVTIFDKKFSGSEEWFWAFDGDGNFFIISDMQMKQLYKFEDFVK